MHIKIILVLLAAIIGGVLVFSPPLQAAEPTPLACPNSQTVFLEGQAAPREALLIFMRGRAVGGGLSGPDGRYKLPLRPQERPGSYLVEVRVRSSGVAVGAFTCFVDVPVGAIATPTATAAATRAAVTAAPGAPTPTRSPQPTGALASPTTATTRAPVSATATPRATVATTTTVTTTVTTTATVTTTTSVTPVTTGTVKIDTIELRSPEFPDTTYEYVTVFNTSDDPVTLTGWRLNNASRPELPSYVFPSFVLDGDTTIAVLTTVGDDDPDAGEFYWDQQNDVWRVGDRAELRDPQGRLIATFIVPIQTQ